MKNQNKGNKEKIIRMRFCPRCRSPDVQKPVTILTVIGIDNAWLCNNCGFKGHMFPELVEIKSKGKNEKRKN